MTKKIKRILLMLCMLIMILPIQVSAAGVTKYDVYVGGVQVTSENMSDVLGDGTVSYTPASGENPAKLVLDNASIKNVYGFDLAGEALLKASIYTTEDLNVEFKGKNVINASEGAIVNEDINEDDYNEYDVYPMDFLLFDDCNVTFLGDGTLEMMSGLWQQGGKLFMNGGHVIVHNVYHTFGDTNIFEYLDGTFEGIASEDNFRFVDDSSTTLKKSDSFPTDKELVIEASSKISGANKKTVSFEDLNSTNSSYFAAYVRITSETVVAKGTVTENITWKLNADGVLTISGTGDMQNYNAGTEMPWTSKKSSISEIVVEDGITSIGAYAFYYCSNVKKVTLPATMKTIGAYAFYYCSNLTEIHMASAFTVSTVNSFYGTNIKNVYVDDIRNYLNVTHSFSITSSNFTGSFGYRVNNIYVDDELLNNIIIPDDITSLRSYVFYNIKAERITIHKNITSVGSSAFNYTSGYKVYYPGTSCDLIIARAANSTLKNITLNTTGAGHVYDSVTLDSANSKVTYKCSKCNSASYYITYASDGEKASITKVYDYPLKEYTFPSSIDGMPVVRLGGTNASSSIFSKTDALETVVIPDTVTVVAPYLFNSCTNLKNVTFSKNMTAISSDMFLGCTSLKTLNIPDSVDTLGYASFYGCTSLTSVNFSEKVTAIPDYAFYKCTGLTSVDIPERIKSIGSYAYAYSGITSFKASKNLESINIYAFSNCSSLTSLDLSDSKVTSVNSNLCNNDTNLKELKLPNALTIYDQAFYGCTSLEEVTIPDGVTTISNKAFYNCNSLKKIVIPSSVTTMNTSYKIVGYKYDSIYGKDVLIDDLYIYCDVDSAAYRYAVANAINTKVVPAKPTGVYVKEDGDDNIITWNAAGGAESYKIYRKTGNSAATMVAMVASDTLSVRDEDVASDGKYTYYVEACSEIGSSTSDEVNVIRSGKITLSVKDNVLRWNKIDGAKAYNVYGIATGSTILLNCIDATKENEFALSPTSDITSYFIKPVIMIDDAVYVGSSSNTVDAVYIGDFSSLGMSDTWIYWDGKFASNVLFDVYMKVNNGEYSTIVQDASDYSIQYSSTLNSTDFATYKVIAKCDIDGTVYSSEPILRTFYGDSVNNFKVVSTKNGVRLDWDKCDGAIKYHIIRYPFMVQNGTVSDWYVDADKTSYEDSISENNIYHYSIVPVKNVTIDGDTVAAEGMNVYEIGLTFGAPSISSVELKSGKAVVSWDISTNYSGNIFYDVYRKKENGDYTLAASDLYVCQYVDSDVDGESNYTYKVVGKVHFEGIGTSGFIYSDPSEPRKVGYTVVPEINKAESVENGIKISWNQIDGCSGYTVFRSVDDKNYESVGVLTKSSNITYTDTTVAGGTVYFYKVVSVYKSGSDEDAFERYSDKSNSVKGCFVKAVKLVSAGAETDGIMVKWEKSEGAGSYTIYRSTNDGDFTVLKASVTGVSYKDTTALSDGTKYSYKVVACKNIDSTTYKSNESNVISTCSLKQVKITKITNVKKGTIINWSANVTGNGYVIYRSADGGKFKKIKAFTTNKILQFTDTTVKSGYAYVYVVAATKVIDEVTYEGCLSEDAINYYVPTAYKLSAKNSKKGQISVSSKWTGTKLGKVTYEIQYSTSSKFTKKTTKKVTSTKAKAVLKKGIKKGKKYYVRVRVCDKISGKKYYSEWTDYKTVKIKK